VTTLFNPAGYATRYALYRRFAARIQHTGATLVTIEAIFPKLGQHQFNITDANNPNHMQVKLDTVFWAKEGSVMPRRFTHALACKLLRASKLAHCCAVRCARRMSVNCC
jgi:hypothetical protein